MYSTYREEKARLSPDEIAKLEEIEAYFISTSASTRHFLDAVLLEQHLTCSEWGEILTIFLTSFASKDRIFPALVTHFAKLIELTTSRIDHARMFDFRPCGPELEAIDPTKATLGRVVRLDRLVSPFQNRYSLPRDLAETRLRRLLERPGITTPNFPLGMYLMWSTFDEAMSDDPFRPSFSTITELLCQLGLCEDARQRTGTYVFLSYKLPDHHRAHVPTIIEAFAAGQNVYFRPLEIRTGAPAANWPRTFPCQSYYDDRTKNILALPIDVPGRPEIVHAVLFANQLTRPPEIRRIEVHATSVSI